MNHPRRLVLPLLAIALAGHFVGRDDVRAQEKKVAAKAAPVRVALAAPANAIPDESFEQYFFQRTRSAAAARKQFESQLTLLVDEMDRACQLSDAQKAKLRVTGQGDLKRLFDGFEAAKRRFNELNNDAQQLGAVLEEFLGVQAAASVGVFTPKSLFVKSLRNVLSAEQFAKYEVVTAERRSARHRAGAELVVAVFEQATPLRDEQRRKLLQLLIDEIKPVPAQGFYEMYWLMDQLAGQPEAKFKSLFTDTQWRVVNRQLTQYKDIVPQLRQMGVWSDDDGDADAAPKK